MLVLGDAGVNAAGTQPVRHEFTELHMGMPVRLVLHASDEAIARDAARAAFARIAALENVMSDYRPASEVRRLTEVPAGVRRALSPELCDVLGRALELARESGGAFDPTVGAYVELWRAARATGKLPSRRELDSAARRAGWWRVRLDRSACTVTFDEEGIRLDFGGIAKGYILDQALAVLAARGVSRALLEAGGDIVVGDPPPGAIGWRIEVRHAGSELATHAASLARAAISTSGDGEQYVEVEGIRYSHLIDPRTGLGSTARTVASVIARDAATADALATALAVLGADEGRELVERWPGIIAADRQSDSSASRRPRNRCSGSCRVSRSARSYDSRAAAVRPSRRHSSARAECARW